MRILNSGRSIILDGGECRGRGTNTSIASGKQFKEKQL